MTTVEWVHPAILLVALALAVATIWAIIVTLRDPHPSPGDKLYWTLILLVLPAIGLTAWLLIYRRHRNALPDAR